MRADEGGIYHNPGAAECYKCATNSRRLPAGTCGLVDFPVSAALRADVADDAGAAETSEVLGNIAAHFA